jgi:glycosyltransferase involved in cell wall biosynthesis
MVKSKNIMKISVAMCTYNGAPFIREQLDSILQQTLAVDEIVICDDGSTDETIEIIKAYQIANPKLITLHQNDETLRSVKNFEKCIKLCQGDLIFLCDQDDIWLASKVATHVAYYEAHPHIKVIASNGYCINEQSLVEDCYSLWDVPTFLEEQGHTFDYYELISFVGNIATGATMSFKKDFHAHMFPFPIIKNFHHDEWLIRLASLECQFILIPDKLTRYRIHSQQQVGGVFFPKTVEKKEMLSLRYSSHLSAEELKLKTFKFYQRQLKILTEVMANYRKFTNYFKDRQSFFFDAFHSRIEVNNCKILMLKKEMKKAHPIKSFCIEIINSILRKNR